MWRRDIVWFTFIIDEEFRKFVQSPGIAVHFDQFVMKVVRNDDVFRIASHVNYLQPIND